MKPFGINFNQRQFVIPLVIVGTIVLAVAKDVLHAFYINSSFYLSESILFELFWPLFVPFVILYQKLLNEKSKAQFFLFPLVWSVIHLMIFSLTVNVASGIFMYHRFSFWGTFIATLSDGGLACFLIYGACSVVFGRSQGSKLPKKTESTIIKVTHQGKVICLDIKEIILVKSDRPYIALVTKGGPYLLNRSIKDFTQMYASDNFVQVHKSTVINTDYVQSYQSRKNGDYDVLMTNGKTIRASRNFNSWFKTT
ncbi:MAG: LytTR family DNA-binding domain-containing protein [Marinoscillum sp.]